MAKFLFLSLILNILNHFTTVASTTEFKFQILKGNSKLSTIDLAIQITSSAKTLSLNEDFICETWLFATISNDTVNSDADISTSFSSTPIGQLYPIVLSSSNPHHVDYHHTYYQNYNYSGASDTSKPFTYHHYEFSEDDIKRVNHLGVMRHGVNCVSVFIVGGDGISTALYLTNKVIEKKLARPHRDYFMYLVGWAEDAANAAAASVDQNWLVQQILWKKQELLDMRYKYVFNFKPASASSSSRTRTATMHNVCERSGETLNLFSKTCNSHIIDRHYKVTSCYIAPLVRYKNNPDGSRKWGSGMLFSMFLEASYRYNFTFDIKYAGFHGSSGFRTKQGVWFGAVGEVFKREADAAFAVGITIHRHHIIDPSMTQTWITRVFFIRSPSLKTSYASILWPMEPHIWILTIVTTIIALPVCYWAAVVYFKTSGTVKPTNLFWDVVDVMNRILMEQSATARPWKGNRIRLLILLWTGFCLVIETGYRSKLVTFLTFLEREEIPKTHMELSLSKYKLFFRTYNGVAYQYTVASKDPMHKRILQKSTLSNHSHDCIHSALLTDNSACLDYRLNGQFAITTNATLFMNQNSELLITSKDTDFTTNIVWAFRKGSPWTASFDKVILNSLAAGLYNKWKDEDWAKSRIESSQHLKNLDESPVRDKIQSIMADMNIGPKALDRKSLEGTYIIFLAGVMLGFIGWIAEHISVCSFLATFRVCLQMRRQRSNIS